MADDRNSGMNIFIPFSQTIQRYAVNSDWTWGSTSSVNDIHVGRRKDEEDTPSTQTINMDNGPWWEDGETYIYYSLAFRDIQPVSVTQNGSSCSLVGSIASLDAVDKYYWEKGRGLFLYNSSAAPSDVDVVVAEDAWQEIYALTEFGLNTEELLNSPTMDVGEGFYSFIEQISSDENAAFRTSSLSSEIYSLIRYSQGQIGFDIDFLYSEMTRPYHSMCNDGNFVRKYIEPIVNPEFQNISSDSSGDSLVSGVVSGIWGKNINITCAAKMPFLESVKYADYSDASEDVFDPRQRAFCFGISYPKEYVGAVDSDFMKNCNYWAICMMKIKGKVRDWQIAYKTTDNGSTYTNSTAACNKKNDGDIQLDTASTDWIALGCVNKFFAITVNLKEKGALANRELEIQYLNSSSVWTTISSSVFYDSEIPWEAGNQQNIFQKKTVGDFYIFDYSSVSDWEMKSLNGYPAYWIRIRAIHSGTQALTASWISLSGFVVFDPDYEIVSGFSRAVIRDEAPGDWIDDSAGFVPISINYIEEKKQIWGCFLDIISKKYFPFAVQFNRANALSSLRYSFTESYIKLFNNAIYNYDKKFHSFELLSNTEVACLVSDDKNKSEALSIIKFSSDFTGNYPIVYTKANFIGKYRGRLIFSGYTTDSLFLWDGSKYFDVDLSSFSGTYINDAVEYEGELYFAREASNTLLKFDGTTVSYVTETSGLFTTIYSLCIYNGVLYIAGESAGNVALVVSFDGTTASTARTNNNYSATSLFVYDEKLYVGYYSKAATSNLTIEYYDGTSWTSDFSGGAETKILSFFNLNGILYAVRYQYGSGSDEILIDGHPWDAVITTLTLPSTPSGNKSLVYNGNAYVAGYNAATSKGAIILFDGEYSNEIHDTIYDGVVNSMCLFGDTLYFTAVDSSYAHIGSYNIKDFEVDKRFIGGSGVLPNKIMRCGHKIKFPSSTSEDFLRKYTICGAASGDKGIAWEYSNYKGNYINIHSVVDNQLDSFIKDLTLVNSAVFYANGDGQLIFTSKNLRGVSDYVFTLSNKADYGKGLIRSVDDISLYENILNKINVSWSNDLFGSGTLEIGSGIGIGKKLSISNDIVADEFKAKSISNSILRQYGSIREQMGVDSIILFFLELMDVVKVDIEHKTIYVDSTKEWIVSKFDFDLNNLSSKFSLIERVLEA